MYKYTPGIIRWYGEWREESILRFTQVPHNIPNCCPLYIYMLQCYLLLFIVYSSSGKTCCEFLPKKQSNALAVHFIARGFYQLYFTNKMIKVSMLCGYQRRLTCNATVRNLALNQNFITSISQFKICYVFLNDESLFTCPPHNILKYINSTFCIAMMLLNVDEQVGDSVSCEE